MRESRLGSGLGRLFIYCLVFAVTVPVAPLGFAAEQKIDLDGNPLNGNESTVETNVLQSFPVEIENIIFNNAGSGFTFEWPGAGPGGFESFLTAGPDVGTKWIWTTVSQVFSIVSPATFEMDSREIPVFGSGLGGVQLPDSGGVFDLPGKSILPTEVTLSSASLTSSLVTFFSPENTIASCDSNFVPGRFEQTITNNTGETVTFMVEEPDCCPEANMTICDDGCQFYLTDDNNCGGCGNVCAFDAFCDQGFCADICPGVGQELCGETCEDTLNDDTNCGGCGNVCAFDEFCDSGTCADICPGAGQELCGQTCVDTFNDDSNCGGCGTVCAFDEFCGGGVCGPICPGVGQAFCNQTCVDTLNDENNCGSCGTICAFDEFCDGGACADICPGVGQEFCNATCVDTLNDAGNCGACGITCAFDEFCDAGICADICPGAGQEFCDSMCVDTLNDVGNCGACGNVCAFDEFCGSGTCEPICPGQILCGTECADIQNDPLNCGGCDNICDMNSICTGGTCAECTPPLQTNCNNECVNLHTDPFNCGGCGMVCDFSDCPSTGSGTCSQGSSCICDPTPSSVEDAYGFSPTPIEVPDTLFSVPAVRLANRRTARSLPSLPPPSAPPSFASESEPRRGFNRDAAAQMDRGTLQTRRDRTVEAATGSVSRGLNVVEAEVCGIPPIMEVIPDGESFTLCQTGAVVGREIFTTVTVMMGGEIIGKGPCALIVPAPQHTIGEFEPSPVSVILIDESGDSLLQPGETAEAKIEVLNLGTADILNPVAVFSCDPDQFNPLSMVYLNDTSVYPDFPALGSQADCTTTPALEPQTNIVNFMFTVPADQEPDVARVCNLNIQGDAGGLISVNMPFVLGIGAACDPATDLDGTTYDGLEGLLSPVNAALVPTSYPVNFAPATVNHGSNVPMKLRLKCASQTLRPDDIKTPPEIVSIRHETAGELPLENIKDSNSNPDDPLFDCGNNRCEFGLRTLGFPVGSIIIGIRMPDSRVYHVGLTTVP
ncbi:MAG: hypothetical protein V3S47_02255 [Acidobacteriota bacterium]